MGDVVMVFLGRCRQLRDFGRRSQFRVLASCSRSGHQRYQVGISSLARLGGSKPLRKPGPCAIKKQQPNFMKFLRFSQMTGIERWDEHQ